MFDPTKPVMTRDGRRAEILNMCQTLSEGGGYIYPIRARVEHPSDKEKWIEWNYMGDGRWKSNSIRNPNDLINIRFWHRWLMSMKKFS